jgi:hypothetical protein
MTDKIAINQHSSPVGHSVGGVRFAVNLGSETSVMAGRKNFKEWEQRGVPLPSRAHKIPQLKGANLAFADLSTWSAV